MTQTATEGTNLNVVVESALGTPGTTGWLQLQPNSYGSFGPSYKKLSRMPISKDRQLQQGILVDLDSGVPFQADVTKDLIDAFLGGIFMSAVKHSGGQGVSLYRPTAITTGSPSSWTVPSGGALIPGILVYGRGSSNAANNGLLLVAAAGSGTTIKTAATLVTETPPANYQLEVAGFRATVAANIKLDANDNLTFTTDDATTLGLNVRQWIWVGGIIGGANAFAINPLARGFARIKAIAAGLITLERRSWTTGGGADVATGKSIDIYFTRWCRNVAINHADFLKTSYSFEVTYPGLSGGTDEYENPAGNMVASAAFNFPLTNKATCDLAFVGTTTADPSTVRLTGASTAIAPVTNVAVSTMTDMMRLRVSNVDETGISTDFQSIKITFKNNVTPEKELGVKGATLLNVGRFEVEVEADMIFTSDTVIKAVSDNRQVAMDVAMRNGDFGSLIDLSALTVMSTDRSLPTNQSVLIKAKLAGYMDPIAGFTAGMSEFAYLPAA